MILLSFRFSGSRQVRLGTLAHQNRQQALGPALAALDRHTLFDVLGEASPRVLSIRRMAWRHSAATL
jgi:hypothetical protein